MKRKTNRSAIVIVGIIAFIVGSLFGALFLSIKTTGSVTQPRVSGSGSKIVMGIPAVDADGKGVIGTLNTEVKPGTGKILVNVIDVITLGDTQQSAQKAAKAAASYTNTDLSNVDIIFNIEVNATTIEGPSAGSSMAISIIFGLRNQTPKPNVMMTGTIDENGNIGRVGSVLEKAKVAKEAGATVFVVPAGQLFENQAVRTKQCKQIGSTQHCKIVYEYKQTSIGEQLNMTVVEAATVADAVKFFE